MTWRFFIQFCRTLRNSSLSNIKHAIALAKPLIERRGTEPKHGMAGLCATRRAQSTDVCWRMLTYAAGLCTTRHSQSTQYITKQTGECLCVLPWAPSFHSALRTVYQRQFIKYLRFSYLILCVRIFLNTSTSTALAASEVRSGNAAARGTGNMAILLSSFCLWPLSRFSSIPEMSR